MSTQSERVCAAAETILRVAKPQKGGHLNYTPYHARLLLELLAREGPAGRPRIMRGLGVGEASARTLISRMVSIGLVERDPGGRGYRLTSKGARVHAALAGALHVYKPRLGVFDDTTAVVVSGVPAPRSLVDVYEVRDYLVMEGCKRSLIGGVEGGSASYPGVPEEMARFLEAWDPGIDYGLVIIVPSQCLPQAYTAALRLLAEACRGAGDTGPHVS